MFNKKSGLLLALLLLLVSVSGVCATDNNTDSLTTVGDNSLELNNTVLSDLTNNETTNTISNDSVDLSTVPCAVSSYINVMESYNKTVDVETGIKETHTVNNTTSILGLTNALTKHGLKCNVIKTKSIDDLTTLYNDKKLNIIVHMFIDNQYHFGHIKEIRKNGILFNDNLFIPYNLLKDYFTGISIIISNETFFNFNSFGLSVNKSEWSNITGKLTQRELFNHNYGLIGKAINLNDKYVKLKENIKDDSNKQGIESTEFILFGNTLKPKMVNLVKIQGQLKPIYNNPKASSKLLSDLNNILTPMQNNLNDTISHLNYLIKMINKHCNKNNLKASNLVVSPIKQVDVPKLLGDGCNLFMDNLKEAINNLNPLNAHPEIREELDQKYGLENHTFGFIDYYTFKK
ncbi:MAG: cysteine peptidase family C39 domain-containing protein [archaeon]|nr:cysteine peptidase family C39 domain-containing protein [archaeon]